MAQNRLLVDEWGVPFSTHAPLDFGCTIRGLREDRGLSLSKAAKAAGLTKAHLHDLEVGRSRNPCISTLIGLGVVYNRPIGYLAYWAARAFEADRLAKADQPSQS